MKNVFFSKSAITFEQHVAYSLNLANICQIISLAILQFYVMIEQGIAKILRFPWWGIFVGGHPVYSHVLKFLFQSLAIV